MIECHFQSLKSIGRLKFAKILFLANTSGNKYIHTYIRDKHKRNHTRSPKTVCVCRLGQFGFKIREFDLGSALFYYEFLQAYC